MMRFSNGKRICRVAPKVEGTTDRGVHEWSRIKYGENQWARTSQVLEKKVPEVDRTDHEVALTDFESRASTSSTTRPEEIVQVLNLIWNHELSRPGRRWRWC